MILGWARGWGCLGGGWFPRAGERRGPDLQGSLEDVGSLSAAFVGSWRKPLLTEF